MNPYKRETTLRGPGIDRCGRLCVTSNARPFSVTVKTSGLSQEALSAAPNQPAKGEQAAPELSRRMAQLAVDEEGLLADADSFADRAACRRGSSSELKRGRCGSSDARCRREIEKMGREFLKLLPKSGGGFEAATY